MTIREQLRGALTNILSNASSYPETVQTRLLGQDMGPLTEKVTAAALAVFEAAQAPTGDERATDDEIRVATLAAVKKGAKNDAEAVRNYREAERVIRAALPHLRRPVQGEPTDAQVKVALDAYFSCDFFTSYPASVRHHEPQMRAALRAAGVTAVQGGQVVPCARCGKHLVVATDALNSDLEACGRCGLEIGAAEAAEQGEVAWEIGYQLLDPDGNSVGVGWPFPSVAEADESGARRAREESDRDPMWPTAHRVVRRRVAGEWLPVEQEGGA